MAMIWGTWNTFGIFFESLTREFALTRAVTSGAISLSNLIFSILCIFSASLSDKFGPRKVAIICSFLLGLSYLLMSQMVTVWQLYLYFGVLLAFGMSSYIPLLSLVAKWFTHRRGMMTGIVFSGMGLGTMIMPPIANHLISDWQWRTSYIIIGLVALVLTMVAAQFLKEAPKQFEQQANTPSNQHNSRDALIETDRNLSLKEAIHTRQFVLLCALYFFFLFCLLTITVHVAIHASGGLKIPADDSANILAIIGGVCIIGMNSMGTIADRFGIKLTLGISFILMTISLIWLIFADTIWAMYLFAVIFGFAYGGMQVLFSPLVAELFGLRSHGVILGAGAFIGGIGGAIGPIIAGYIFDVLNSYNLAFMLCASIAFAGIVMVLLLEPVKQRLNYTVHQSKAG